MLINDMGGYQFKKPLSAKEPKSYGAKELGASHVRSAERSTSSLVARSRRGFTLLELLIVIAIIAVLAVVLIIVLDPAETLKKGRDTQRMSDLNTLKTALGIYSTTATSTFLSGVGSNAQCKTGLLGGSYIQGVAGSRVFYSIASGSGGVAINACLDGTCATGASSSQPTSSTLTLTDGTGWLPVNFDSLIGGTPISAEPLDPTNSVASLSQPANTDLTYRYTCNASTTKWEIAAVLESNTFTVLDNKMAKDGGNNNFYYEVGTQMKLLGTGTNY